MPVRKKKPAHECVSNLVERTGHLNNAHIFVWFKVKFNKDRVEIIPHDLKLDLYVKLDSRLLTALKNTLFKFLDNIVRKGATKSIRKKLFAYFEKASTKKAMSIKLNDLLYDLMLKFLEKKWGIKDEKLVEKVKGHVRIIDIEDVNTRYAITRSYPKLLPGTTQIPGQLPSGSTKKMLFKIDIASNVDGSSFIVR